MKTLIDSLALRFMAFMEPVPRLVALIRFCALLGAAAAPTALSAEPSTAAVFQPVPELGYQVKPDFFHLPEGMTFGEASGVALDSRGHIFLFHRGKAALMEFDSHRGFLRSIGEGLFDHPHGLRIDSEDNLWTTDDGSHLVLKLNRKGKVLLVLGHRGEAGEATWLFNRPTDVAWGRNGEIYVADGYGNSRVVKFDHDGNFLKAWGKRGIGPGEFVLPHSVAVDREGRVYVGDRENQRIQIFDPDGTYLKEWAGIGYPYGLFITPDQHVWMADGGYDRIIEIDPSGRILGAFGEPGHAPGQFAWAHFLTVGPDRRIYVADVLNWRFQVFTPTRASGKMVGYVPSQRRFFAPAAPNASVTSGNK